MAGQQQQQFELQKQKHSSADMLTDKHNN